MASHAYSTLLKANGEDVKVVQELMRHANISTTMNIYTKALTSAEREAQSRVVDVLLDRSRNVWKVLLRMQHENQRIESVSRFFCESAKLLGLLVDLIGIEPMTSSMPWPRGQ